MNLQEDGRSPSAFDTQPIPAARPLSDFSVELVGDELVILDGETLQYHTINSTAGQIWQACDGTATSNDIAHNMDLPVEVVESTIAELGEVGLLQSAREQWNSTVTRRRASKLIAAGLVGAVGLPVIKSITAPDAASAASRGQCQFGFVAGPWICGVCRFFGCACEQVQPPPGWCCVCGGGGAQVFAASGPSYDAFMAAVNQAQSGKPITGYDDAVYIDEEPVEPVEEKVDTAPPVEDTIAPESTEESIPAESQAPVDPPADQAASDDASGASMEEGQQSAEPTSEANG